MEFYTLDRVNSLASGQIIGLQKFCDITPVELQNHLELLFPEGVSRHGDQYIASAFNSNNQVNGLIEIIFEFVRRGSFQDKLSRMQSIFAFDSLAQAESFEQNFGNQNSTIWKVYCDNYFKADMNLLKLPPSGLIISSNAHKYWRGEAGSNLPCWEYLLSCPVKVLEKV